jgi:tetratricopeptide (TPR) repeat protein
LQEFESILSDLLARHGEKHERVGAALHNVAIANLRAGSLDDAMDAIEEAIKIRSRALGRSHPKVADSLVELGIILLSMEEHADSLKVFDRALRLRRSEPTDMMLQDEIDENNLKIAKVLNNMGCVNYERQFLEEAKKSFQEAVGLQKSVFRNMFNLSVGYDTSSPGILTMASTMCNLGYVAIEQGDFSSAINTLTISLKIQKAVLGQSNKLVQSTLDNLGYAAAMQNQYDASLGFYNEIWLTQKDINESNEEKARTLRKLITASARTEDYDKCFAFLEVMEDLLAEIDPDSEALFRTRKLMGEVNYQLLKLPSLSDQTNRAVGFALCIGETEEDVDLEEWVITKPENTSKMSGHRVTHA